MCRSARRWDRQRLGHTASLRHFQEARYRGRRKHDQPAPSPGCAGESPRSGAHLADGDRRPSRDSNLFQCGAPRVVVADPLAIGRKEDAAGHRVGASDRNGLQLVDRAHVQLARPISARAIEDEMAAVAGYREPLRRIPRERHARRERTAKRDVARPRRSRGVNVQTAAPVITERRTAAPPASATRRPRDIDADDGAAADVSTVADPLERLLDLDARIAASGSRSLRSFARHRRSKR